MASSPEVVKVFDDAVEVFDAYGLTEYMDMFDAVAFEDPNANDTQTLDALQLNLRTVLNHLIAMQGLNVHEHVLTSQIVEMAAAMLALVDYEDQDTLSSILDGDFDDHEKAAEMLALLTPYTAEEHMGLLLSVDDTFVDTFKTRLSMKAVDAPVDYLLVEKQITAYTAYKKLLQSQQIFPDRFFVHLPAIGLTYAEYLRIYQGDVAPETLVIERAGEIAKELVGMALLSSDGVDNPLIVVRRQLSDLFGDINTTTKVDVAVSKLCVEVSHAQT